MAGVWRAGRCRYASPAVPKPFAILPMSNPRPPEFSHGNCFSPSLHPLSGPAALAAPIQAAAIITAIAAIYCAPCPEPNARLTRAPASATQQLALHRSAAHNSPRQQFHGKAAQGAAPARNRPSGHCRPHGRRLCRAGSPGSLRGYSGVDKRQEVAAFGNTP